MKHWHVTDHATARVALGHPDLSRSPHLRQADDPLEQHVLNLDGEAHARMRAALAAALDASLPAAVAAVRSRAAQLLAGFDGEVDVAARFARPLVLHLLDHVLDLTGGDERELLWWHTVALDMEARRADTVEIHRRVGDLVARRRAEPGPDVISRLAADELPVEQVIATVWFAFDAGYVNTVNFLGLSLLALAAAPAEYAWLRAHPHAVPGAVDELLRFAEPSGRASMRVAARDTEVGDVPVPASTTVWIHRAAANRDPARFPGGNRLDLQRPVGGSLAFGAGRHFCLGAELVRACADLTLVALIQIVAELAPTPRTPLDWDFPAALPLTVRPVRPAMSD